MPLTLTVCLKNCNECQHIGHSGPFTEGGAKPICDHPDVVKMIQKFKPHLRNDDTNDDKTNWNKQVYYWGNRVIPYKNKKGKIRGSYREAKGTIPKWCPLKNGSTY